MHWVRILRRSLPMWGMGSGGEYADRLGLVWCEELYWRNWTYFNLKLTLQGSKVQGSGFWVQRFRGVSAAAGLKSLPA